MELATNDELVAFFCPCCGWKVKLGESKESNRIWKGICEGCDTSFTLSEDNAEQDEAEKKYKQLSSAIETFMASVERLANKETNKGAKAVLVTLLGSNAAKGLYECIVKE